MQNLVSAHSKGFRSIPLQDESRVLVVPSSKSAGSTSGQQAAALCELARALHRTGLPVKISLACLSVASIRQHEASIEGPAWRLLQGINALVPPGAILATDEFLVQASFSHSHRTFTGPQGVCLFSQLPDMALSTSTGHPHYWYRLGEACPAPVPALWICEVAPTCPALTSAASANLTSAAAQVANSMQRHVTSGVRTACLSAAAGKVGRRALGELNAAPQNAQPCWGSACLSMPAGKVGDSSAAPQHAALPLQHAEHRQHSAPLRPVPEAQKVPGSAQGPDARTLASSSQASQQMSCKDMSSTPAQQEPVSGAAQRDMHEARFLQHWNRVSVWTDVVFMLIALFTQLYWLVRWDFLDSMTCTLAMLSVLVCNSIMLGLVYYSRAAYVRHRVALCTVSHILHKLSQSAITLAPIYGIVYSPSYSRVVAVLESSSVAQMWMLSYGLCLPVKVHLPVNTLLLLLAFYADPAICANAFGGSAACTALLPVWQVAAGLLGPSLVVMRSEARGRRAFAAQQKGQ